MLKKIITKTLIATIIITGAGVASIPLASDAAECAVSSGSGSETGWASGETSASCDVRINAPVGAVIEITSMTFNEGVPLEVIPGGAVAEGNLVVKVLTNNLSGYTLKLATMNGTIGDFTASQAPKLELSSGSTIPAGAPAASISAWGVKGGNQSYANAYTALGKVSTPASPNDSGYKTFYVSSSATPAVENTQTFTVGVSANASQLSGTYRGIVTAIATVNS